MKLFKLEIARGRKGRDIVCHAVSADSAERHVQSKFRGWTVRQLVEIPRRAHFTVFEWELEPLQRRKN
jgi:hypothetical protein